jgi:hypothetical protein
MPRRPIRQQTDRTGDSDETYDPATDLHHGHGEPTSVRLNTAREKPRCENRDASHTPPGLGGRQAGD